MATIYDVALVPANPAAATADELKAIKKEGIEAMEMYIKHQLFVAGLREPLRSEVMKEGKATLWETVDLADELEAKIKAHLGVGVQAAEEQPDDEPEEDIEF